MSTQDVRLGREDLTSGWSERLELRLRLDFNLDDEEGGGGGGCALQLTDRLRGWRGRKSFEEVTWTQTVPSVETLVTATLSGRFSTKAGIAAVCAFAN